MKLVTQPLPQKAEEKSLLFQLISFKVSTPISPHIEWRFIMKEVIITKSTHLFLFFCLNFGFVPFFLRFYVLLESAPGMCRP